MRRRAFLGTVGAVAVTGCFGGGGGDETTTSTSTSTTAATTTATTAASTTTTRSGPALAVGDWYATGPYRVVVDRVAARQVLHDSVHHRTLSMPAGEALLVVDIRLKNTSTNHQPAIPGRRFGAVVDGSVRPAVSSFPHPGVDGEFELWWLAYADERNHLPIDGGTFTIEPGGYRTLWYAVPVPTDVGEYGAALDADGDGGFEVWWLPD
ncbi:MAG: hypothetical protein ABEJ57_06070 [Halobacteriaceae archaeon]